MELQRINQVVKVFGISSRTLRYYEEIGLIRSVRPDFKKQRYYDDAALERLKQIIILRKLQIPIKEITKIYEREDTIELIKTFIRKMDAIDKEISSLAELRQIIDEFVTRMTREGIKKISGITLLYEETQEIIERVQEAGRIPTMERINRVSQENLKLGEVKLIRLPESRMLTSLTNEGIYEDIEKAQADFENMGITSTPGLRDSFYVRKSNGEWLLMNKVGADFCNSSGYKEVVFGGGLFAVTTSFMETMDDKSVLLNKWVEMNEIFELDTDEQGNWRCEEMIEELFPWDIARLLNRYQQDIFIPIRTKGEREDGRITRD